nr:DUF3396 domain-containing protein [Methylobacterium sp. OTU13CASTA1]
MTEVPDYIRWQTQRDPSQIETQLVYRSKKLNKIVSRVGGMISLYFLDGHRPDRRQNILCILEEYIELFEKKITHFKEAGSRSYKKMNPTELRKYCSKFINSGNTEDFYCSIINFDSREEDDPSLWRGIAFGFDQENTTRRLSGIKFHFPPSFILDDPDRFVSLICDWAGRLGVLHGSGGLGVLTEPGRETVGKVYYYPLMQRYPALEYDAMGDYWSETRFGGYEVPRASNWLTLLGDANIARLGGEDAIRSQLTPELSLAPYAGGVLIRAGQAPVVDSNGIGGIPQAYRDAARIIKPIRFEGYEYGIIEVPEEKDDLEETLKWVRRFD